MLMYQGEWVCDRTMLMYRGGAGVWPYHVNVPGGNGCVGRTMLTYRGERVCERTMLMYRGGVGV